MSERRSLRIHVGSSDGWGSFWPTSAPAFAGSSSGAGIDWVCPACGTALVQGAAHEDQFLDLLVKCYSCGQVGDFPVRQSGRPLAGQPVLCPPGNYLLASTVDITDNPVMVVGSQALDGYISETGQDQPMPSMELSPRFLREATAFAIELLGDRYSDLLLADQRGQVSPTPPARRHRLIELIEYAHEAADLLEAHRPDTQLDLDGTLLSELMVFTAVFRRWSKHPEWPKLVGTLSHETEVQHSVMLLAVASYLTDAGNGVGVIGDSGGSRVPDLWSEPTLLERLEIEIKTPQELRGPRDRALRIDEAARLLERQVNDAAATKGDQLNPEFSGILAVGGFHLGDDGLDVLEAAAKRVLSRQAERKRHLAGLLVSNLSYEASYVEELVSGRVSTAAFAPSLDSRLVKHPGYGGALNLEQDEPRWREFQSPSSGSGSALLESPSAVASRSSKPPSKKKSAKATRKAQRESRRRNRRP